MAAVTKRRTPRPKRRSRRGLATVNIAKASLDAVHRRLWTGVVFPAYENSRSIKFLTFDTCQRPPRSSRVQDSSDPAQISDASFANSLDDRQGIGREHARIIGLGLSSKRGRICRIDYLGTVCLAELRCEPLGQPMTISYSLNQLHDLDVHEGGEVEIALRTERVRVFPEQPRQ